MKNVPRGIFLAGFLFLFGVLSVLPGDLQSSFEKGSQAYKRRDYREAEALFRAVTKDHPDFYYGHVFLAHSLYYQEKYEKAIPEYERARELGRKSGEMDQMEERILTDQLGLAFAFSGQLDRTKELMEGAIKKDPSYPMYYYILGCTFAELGDLDGAIGNLKLGFDRKSNMLPGESYPNPRTDDSFKKFVGNEKFERALKEMGF